MVCPLYIIDALCMYTVYFDVSGYLSGDAMEDKSCSDQPLAYDQRLRITAPMCDDAAPVQSLSLPPPPPPPPPPPHEYRAILSKHFLCFYSQSPFH